MSGPDPQLYATAVAREERDAGGVPTPLAATPWALLAALALLVVLSPSAPRRR